MTTNAIRLSALFLLIIAATGSYAQKQNDKIDIRAVKPGFYDKDILKGIQEFERSEAVPEPKPSYKIDVSKIGYYPKSVDEFTTWWKNAPVSQGNTSTCWSFSTTSYFETEVYRLSKQQVRLSEMYVAYWEFVEKARRYIRQRGNSNFDEGSEASGLMRIYRTYGCVPLESYSGLLPGLPYYDHSKMFAEMKAFLGSVKATNAWDEDGALATIKSIMNHYMGQPPAMVKANGRDYTPKQYLADVLKLNMDDYIDLVSLMSKPYYSKMEYEVPDNWWHDANYVNVPLDDFMAVVKNGVKKGYTMMIGGDVSEPGFDAWNQIAVIPSFDIPSEYIDENARLLRFVNGSTTDDHGMHITGFLEKDGKMWFLVKDSGSGSRNCGKDSKNFGYYFMQEDYVKLKIMDVLIHKDMVKEILAKVKS